MEVNVLSEIKGMIGAMQHFQKEHGEYAKVHCSVIEEQLNKILLTLEKERSN